MARDGFTCIHCGQTFAWQPGADLHCDEECRKEYEAAIAEAQQRLLGAGFEPYTAAPNIWTKDYVAITLEQVLNEGFEAAIAAHAIAVQELATRRQA